MQRRSAWVGSRVIGSACSFLLSAYCLVLTAGPVSAADVPETEVLKQEIQSLKARLASLETKLAAQEARGAATYQAPEGEGSVIRLPSGLKGIELSGFLESSYTYNFEEPINRLNAGRVFDQEANGFTPHAFELVLQKPVSDESPVGFRTDLFVGDDAEVFGAAGLGSTADEIDLQQAFITYRAPVGSGLDLKLGKFVTLLGAEVIESKDNWNFSRSYMFGYSIPFTHTGLLASYAWNEWLGTTFGVVNGWDVVDDNNKAKTLLGNVTLGPWNNVTLSLNGVVGAERANDNSNQRAVMSNVLTWAATDDLTFMFNYDYGVEDDAVGIGKDANWDGYAVYAKYAPLDWWSVAGRYEFFHDRDAVRVAPTVTVLSGAGHGDVEFQELTLTNEFKLHEHLIARLEYRLDLANAQVFGADRGANNHLNTVAAEIIVPF